MLIIDCIDLYIIFGFSLQYSDYVRYVEPCFKGTLVQADLDNREVTQSRTHTHTLSHMHAHTHTRSHN